jgi:hypothetical protein
LVHQLMSCWASGVHHRAPSMASNQPSAPAQRTRIPLSAQVVVAKRSSASLRNEKVKGSIPLGPSGERPWPEADSGLETYPHQTLRPSRVHPSGEGEG